MRFFIFAGETSGDLHGSHLIKALKTLSSTLTLTGVAGPSMRKEGITSLLKMEDFQIMGFSDVLRSIPKLWKQFYLVRDFILDTRPDCVVLIDYPGFNLRLAKALRNKQFKGKIVQYICPTVWAHSKKRIDVMVNTLDLLLTIYPFESTYFSHTPLRVEYIGNPLVQTIRQYTYQPNWSQSIGLSFNQPVMALFPGSRLGEITNNLPIQLQAAAELKRKNPTIQFALSYTQDQLLHSIQDLIHQSPLKIDKDIFFVPKQFSYELMQGCHTALAKSGTVTLELALHHRPSIVTYQLSYFNYFMAKYWLRLQLPHYCIVNILGQKEIFPELIGKRVSPNDLFNQLERVFHNEDIRLSMVRDCQSIEASLGDKQSHHLAAKTVMELLIC